MSMATKARRLPGRPATGAFVRSAGLSKWSADEETAAGLHGMAAATCPFLAGVKPKDFARMLSAGEIAVGSALLLPVVPARLAGSVLTAFSGGLLGLYLRTPGMRREGSVRPARQVIPLAKDAWPLAVGLGLTADALTSTRASD